jgi:hypothetical protein
MMRFQILLLDTALRKGGGFICQNSILILNLQMDLLIQYYEGNFKPFAPAYFMVGAENINKKKNRIFYISIYFKKLLWNKHCKSKGAFTWS